MPNLLRKTSILAVLFAMSISSANVLLASEKEEIVKGSYVNLRAEPKFNSQIIGKKLRGDTYKIKFQQQNWLKVEFKDNTEGWIYKTITESSVEPDKTVNAIKDNSDEKKVTAQKAETKPEEKVKTDKSKDKKSSGNKDQKPLIKEEKKENLPEVVEVSGTAEDLYNEAIKLYEKRKYAEALDKNKAASKKAPKNPEILNNLGNCQFKLGRIEEALESWKAALKIAPRSGKICNNLGIAYYQLDKNKDALEYYKKAILFEPDFADPYYNIASVYGFLGNFDEALRNYKKFLEFNPDDTMRKLADERISYCERQLKK